MESRLPPGLHAINSYDQVEKHDRSFAMLTRTVMHVVEPPHHHTQIDVWTLDVA